MLSATYSTNTSTPEMRGIRRASILENISPFPKKELQPQSTFDSSALSVKPTRRRRLSSAGGSAKPFSGGSLNASFTSTTDKIGLAEVKRDETRDSKGALALLSAEGRSDSSVSSTLGQQNVHQINETMHIPLKSTNPNVQSTNFTMNEGRPQNDILNPQVSMSRLSLSSVATDATIRNAPKIESHPTLGPLGIPLDIHTKFDKHAFCTIQPSSLVDSIQRATLSSHLTAPSIALPPVSLNFNTLGSLQANKAASHSLGPLEIGGMSSDMEKHRGEKAFRVTYLTSVNIGTIPTTVHLFRVFSGETTNQRAAHAYRLILLIDSTIYRFGMAESIRRALRLSQIESVMLSLDDSNQLFDSPYTDFDILLDATALVDYIRIFPLLLKDTTAVNLPLFRVRGDDRTDYIQTQTVKIVSDPTGLDIREAGYDGLAREFQKYRSKAEHEIEVLRKALDAQNRGTAETHIRLHKQLEEARYEIKQLGNQLISLRRTAHEEKEVLQSKLCMFQYGIYSVKIPGSHREQKKSIVVQENDAQVEGWRSTIPNDTNMQVGVRSHGQHVNVCEKLI